MTEREIPANHVLGVMHDPRRETLATDLRSAGFGDFAVMTREDVGEQAGAGAESSNPVARVIDQIRNRLNEDLRYLEQYRQQAREGNPVIAVKVRDDREAEQVRDVLARNHVLDIRYFSDVAVKDLSASPSTSDYLP